MGLPPEREKLPPRKPIPVAVKCRVVLRQLGEMFIEDVIRANRFIPRDHRKRSLGRLLEESIERLRVLQGEEGEPELDHDPQLWEREKIRNAAGEIIGYIPDEHDPERLFYRWDHGIKTNVRGDHGDYSDVQKRKRARRRRREPYVSPLGPKSKRIKSGGKSLITHNRKRGPSVSGSKLRTGKRKWGAGRKLRSQNNLRRRK